MYNSNWKQNLLAIIMIATLYIYFLIFAQFAFLENLKVQLGSTQFLRLVMGCMGIAGVIFSLLTIKLLDRYSVGKIYQLGLMTCLLASLLSLTINSVWLAALTAMIIAAGIAILSVCTIVLLGTLLSEKFAGTLIGIGTGIAYFCCNIPWLFQASATTQAIFSGIICLALSLCLLFIPIQWISENCKKFNPQNFSFRPLGFIGCVVIFTVLVWLDSAAFFIIQQSPEYKSLTWQSFSRLWVNGSIHLISALLAGILIDLKQAKVIAIIAFCLLSAAALTLINNQYQLEIITSPLYCAGVSFYSTALIAYPLLGVHASNSSVALRAARLYAFAGWIGSALGIGMAQDLNYIPILFLVIAGLVIFSLNIPIMSSGNKKLLTFSALAILTLSNPLALLADDSKILRGRKIYLQEGCINCHSQFVRSGTKDVELWGPAAKDLQLHLKQVPPLIGNRRVGPDLQNIGNRRNAEWLKLHFIQPALLSNGSKMPSYQHLFDEGNKAGEDLIAYLLSLGKDTIAERVEYNFNWKPKESTPITSRQAGLLFEKSCQQCHASINNQTAILYDSLSVKPPNLFKDQLSFYDDQQQDIQAIFRIIKFGLPGSTMPGHEYFSDDEIIGIGKYIQSQRGFNNSAIK